eukprot:9480962-Pyramimonas_sp.AAC.1
MAKWAQNVRCNLKNEAGLRMHLEDLEACPSEYRANMLSAALRQDLDQQSLNLYVAEGILGDFLKDLEIAMKTESSRDTLGSIKS